MNDSHPILAVTACVTVFCVTECAHAQTDTGEIAQPLTAAEDVFWEDSPIPVCWENPSSSRADLGQGSTLRDLGGCGPYPIRRLGCVQRRQPGNPRSL